jgi:hypothetical protein
MLVLGATLTALGAMSVAADTIYRWVDENGVVNYTQQKPRDTDSEAITTRGGPHAVAKQSAAAQPAPVSDPSTGEPLSPEQKKMLQGLRNAEQARQDEIAKIKAQNCQQSRDVLARLSVKSRIRVRGDDGEYRIMPEDERQQRIDEAQKNVALYCAPA